MMAITTALSETNKHEMVKGKFLAGLQLNNDASSELRRIGEQILASNDTTTSSSDVVRTIETWMMKNQQTTTTTAKVATSASATVIPLSVLSSMRTILKTSNNVNSSLSTQLQQELEDCLSQGGSNKLKFDVPPPREKTPEEIEEAIKFQKRMELLRMKAEENSYKTYTTNLDKSGLDDDVTTKSMTYAASIGLNMIVAPISFGIFVYFFASPLVFKDDSDEEGPKKIHIGRVISAVVAGVLMLMIEMILFVIRSHELDTHTTKKKLKRSKEYGAFGSKVTADTNLRDFYE